MKKLRFAVLLLAVSMTLSLFFGTAAMASEPQLTADSDVTISFYRSSSPGGGGGGGGGNGGSDKRDNHDRPYYSSDTVTILDPDVPLSTLGPLPKTGSGYLIPLGLIAAGLWLAYIALRCEPGDRKRLSLAI